MNMYFKEIFFRDMNCKTGFLLKLRFLNTVTETLFYTGAKQTA